MFHQPKVSLSWLQCPTSATLKACRDKHLTAMNLSTSDLLSEIQAVGPLIFSPSIAYLATAGWYGTCERKLSKPSESKFITLTGSKLNILAPLKPTDDSLAFLTGGEEDWTTAL